MNFLYPARSLVLQPPNQQAPAGGKDLPVQPGLPSDVTAGADGGSPRTAAHVLDPQVLDADHVEPASEIGGDFLDPVFARVGLVCPQSRYCQLRSAPAPGPSPGAGQLPLQQCEPPLAAAGQSRHMEHLSGRQRGGNSNTAVDAYHLSGSRGRDRLRDGGEGDVPAACSVQGDAVGLRSLRERPRPTELHPADFGHPDPAGLPAEPADMPRLDRNDPEAFMPPGLAPRGPTMCSGKVVGHGPGEVPQRLLLDHLAPCLQPLEVSTRLCELATLLRPARRARPARTPPRVLLTRQVPNESGLRAVSAQRYLLRGRGIQPIPGHDSNITATTDKAREPKRRCPRPEGRGSRTTIR